MGYVDLHTHILPGLDDGPKSWDDTLEMARSIEESGTSIVVATPHYDFESPSFEPDLIKELTVKMTDLLEQKEIGLQVFPGAEVRISTALMEAANTSVDLTPLTINRTGKYLLFELPFTEVPLTTKDAIFALRLRGIHPLLAHPERNLRLSSKSSEIISLVSAGCLIQVNSSSLSGRYGRKAKKTSVSLIKEGLVSAIASDAHSKESGGIDLKVAYVFLTNIGGQPLAQALLKDNPMRIAMGEPLRSLREQRSRGLA